ncbi:unnamed protein product [Ilex paraguariensis]|uniref:Uncharacterized protein n=1 Tax=Ilex paraguariensis TaxID=185542 RepID=A0ABC8S8R0_9AQUA
MMLASIKQMEAAIWFQRLMLEYVGPNQRADLMLACRIRERKESVTVLLCGTSGCGKSTLSALLGSRWGSQL